MNDRLNLFEITFGCVVVTYIKEDSRIQLKSMYDTNLSWRTCLNTISYRRKVFVGLVSRKFQETSSQFWFWEWTIFEKSFVPKFVINRRISLRLRSSCLSIEKNEFSILFSCFPFFILYICLIKFPTNTWAFSYGLALKHKALYIAYYRIIVVVIIYLQCFKVLFWLKHKHKKNNHPSSYNTDRTYIRITSARI